ncbi:MAG: phage terminase large subunit family protein, partial [Geminicoccaceae bacterium]|nr:phage terminase large subunit family protein [Geminicoccaceae bacterium]
LKNRDQLSILVMTGANSAVGLRSMPVKYLFLDEVDGYPLDLDEEGDPVELAIERTATFARRKVFIVSTPTIEGRSRIQAEYEDTDQRKFFVPCPHCGHMQTLEWEQVRWTDLGIPPEQAVYLCIDCEQAIENRQKTRMLPRGEWRPTAKGRPNVRGYHLSGLYRPVGWKSWGDMAVERAKAGKNPARIKSFVNKLGLTFKESGEAPPWRTLFDQREAWHPGEVQPGVLALTCGVDVQKDRLEALIVGWGRNQERWTVDRRVLVGDPAKPDVWRALDRLLVEDFRHPSGGSLSIMRMFVDIGGHFTDEVYSWAGRHQPSVVMPIMGNVRTSVPIGTPHFVERTVNGKKIKRGAQMTPVNSSMFKSRIYNLLRLEPPIVQDEPFPEGFIHIGQYDDEFFQQLTAERLVRRVNKAGFAKLEWEKERERNEVLDMLVYAGAAAMSLGIPRWEAEDWQGIEDSIRTAAPRPVATAEEAGVWRWGSL